MNNKEFANQVADYLFTNSEYANHIKKVLPLFLADNHLQVIDTRDSLLSFCVEDVICHYDYYKKNLTSNQNIPKKLNISQARYILNEANYINTKHEYGLDWNDIELAIANWIEAKCPDY